MIALHPRSPRVSRVAAAALLLVLAACQASVSPSGSPNPSAEGTASSAPTATPDPLDAVRRHTEELRSAPGFAEFQVAGSPDWSVVADDGVWIGNWDTQRLHLLDPVSNSFTSFVPGFGPCNGLAIGFGSLWSADCAGSRMVRVDPATGQAQASIPSSFASEGEGLTAVGEGFVWFIGDPGELVIVDPATNAASSMPVPTGSTSVTVGFGSVWVADPAGGQIVRIDPAARQVVDTIDVGGAPRFLAAGEGAVWALNQADGTVARIDPDDNSVITIDAASPGQGGCIATGAGAVWTTTFDRPLTRIDATTDEVTAQYGGGQNGDCVIVGFDSVWLSNLRTGTVWRIPLPLP